MLYESWHTFMLEHPYKTAASAAMIPLSIILFLSSMGIYYTNGSLVVITKVIILFWGLFLLFEGAAQLQKKWQVVDTPITKIRSVTMGLTKLSGIAREIDTINSPYSNTDCVFCAYKTERLTRNGWRTSSEGVIETSFYIEDDTGKILVDPKSINAKLAIDYIDNRSLLDFRRFKEWYIKPGDKIQVIGTVEKSIDPIVERRDTISQKLNQIKTDRERLMSFDTDEDGCIDSIEWDLARKKVEQEVFEEELKKPRASNDDLVICSGASDAIFFVSDEGDKRITFDIKLHSFMTIIIGLFIFVPLIISLSKDMGAEVLPQGLFLTTLFEICGVPEVCVLIVLSAIIKPRLDSGTYVSWSH
jgi:hypothetical protein